MREGSPTEAFGPYLVYEKLGVGGMAQVHRAIATTSEFQRSIALKRMLSHIAGSEDMVKSFVREARLASYLRHENVAQTYDLGKVGEIYFIEMELITGRNLREVLRHCGATTGPMPVQVALNILNQICDALDYAHNLCDETGQPLGIIHRDVSPSNVIVSDGGVVKLIDFGIAKASAAGMQTLGGTLKGKFGYMAPEYIAGRIDARADLFAVGVIAHELLTNRPLFSGRDDIDTLTRVRDMAIDPPSKKNRQVPPEIDDIVMTALARDPDRRWQHATALRTALTTLTKRLGLIATNTQVIQWFDWAFAQPARKRRACDSSSDHDDDDDREGDAMSDEPSISIEQLTVELGSPSKRIAPLPGHGTPAPSHATPSPSRATPAPSHATPAPSRATPAPSRATPAPSRATPAPSRATPVPSHATPAPPLGAPGYAPAERAAGSRDPRSLATTAAGIGPSRGSRAHPSSAPPPIAASARRTHPASSPPPIAARTHGAPSSVPSSVPPPLTGSVPMSSAPLPVVPGLPSAPFAAPRNPGLPSTGPAAIGTARMPVDPRPANVQRDPAGRVIATAPETVRSGRTSNVTLVILVILAAAVAATTVYFVLPLLT